MSKLQLFQIRNGYSKKIPPLQTFLLLLYLKQTYFGASFNNKNGKYKDSFFAKKLFGFFLFENVILKKILRYHKSEL